MRALAALAACAACACSSAKDPPSAGSPCAAIVVKLRTTLGYASLAGAVSPDAVERIAGIVAGSCEHDHWPPALEQCLLLVSPTDRDGLERCHALVPPALEADLTRQISAALDR